jgi:hypothetical protein
MTMSDGRLLYWWETSSRPSQVSVTELPTKWIEMVRPAAAQEGGDEALEPALSMMLAAGFTLNRIDSKGNAQVTRPTKPTWKGSSATVWRHPDHHVTIWSTAVDGARTGTPYYLKELSEYLGVPIPPQGERASPGGGQATKGLSFKVAIDVRVKPSEWLWKDRLPLGAAAILAGQEGLGKSAMALDLAAQLTRGTLEGHLYGRPADVVFASEEDSEERVIVPRLMAAGADLRRVHFPHLDGMQGGFSVSLHLEPLKTYMKNRARLLVLDPFSSHIGDDKTDSHKERDVRRALAPLAAAMDELDAVAIGIMHWNKAPTLKALDRLLGSRAFSAAARAIIGVGIENEDDSNSPRLVVPVKSNYGPKPTALAFQIEECLLTDPALIKTMRLKWMGEREGVGPSDLFGSGEKDEPGALERALKLIDDLLGNGQEIPSQDLDDAAEVIGVSHGTMKTARHIRNVRPRQRYDEATKKNRWFVRLPEEQP